MSKITKEELKDLQESTSRINSGRGLNSLGTTYFLTNSKNNILGEKITGNSLTARPTFGTSSGA